MDSFSELEHAIQWSHGLQFFLKNNKRIYLAIFGNSKKWFHPYVETRYNDELWAVKAEFDFLRAIPSEAINKITDRMKELGRDDLVAQTEKQWKLAKTDNYQLFHSKHAYNSPVVVQDQSMNYLKSMRYFRNTLFLLSVGGSVSAGVVNSKEIEKHVIKGFTSLCNSLKKNDSSTYSQLKCEN